MSTKRNKHRTSIKRRNPVARDLGSRKYLQRVVPGKKKRGRARMAEIYAREWRMVNDELGACECDARDRRTCQQECSK